MMTTGRRGFLKLSTATLAGAVLDRHSQKGQASPSTISPLGAQYSGPSLSGWSIALGDGLYAAPGEDPVTIDDIETIDYPTYSELRANINVRRIMAHNITFKQFVANNVFDFVHTFGYKFRLPYMPSTDNPVLNPQTIEGAVSLWDGSDTQLAYSTGYQWYINPWVPDVGAIHTWTDIDDGKWVPVGNLAPDTEWHEIRMTLDYRRESTAFVIDDTHYLCRFSGVTRPSDWGTERAATIAAEIINLDPGETHPGALHKAEFKDWYWIWEPYNSCTVFLPMITK
jgi:hypothetical protein